MKGNSIPKSHYTGTAPRALRKPTAKLLAALWRLGDQSVREPLILGHMRLALKLATLSATRAPHLSEDLVGVAWTALVDGIIKAQERLENNNIGGFLNVRIRFALSDYIRHDHTIRYKDKTKTQFRPSTLELREDFDPEHDEHIHLRGYASGAKPMRSRSGNITPEFREALEVACVDERERTIVRMRTQGYKDGEIETAVGLKKSMISRLRKQIYNRFLHYFEEV